MRPYNANKDEQGFTLIENLAIVILLGIVGSITAPHFWKMYKEFEVNQAFNDLQGALQEAQRHAIKKSQTCTITLDKTTKKVIGSSGCLLEERNFPKSVTIEHTGNSTVSFNFRGETNVSSAKTIVLHDANQSNKKCLSISAGIGLMRSGNYKSDPSTVINSRDCISS
jgi:type II secretory pathway pseudopilin PulG